MQTQSITHTFTNHPDLRVLFYFDAEGEQLEDLQAWQDPEIRLVVGSRQYVQLKHRLLTELKGSKVLLYFPFARPTGEAWEYFPLRGLYHANRELSFDESVEFLQKYELPERFLPIVRKYEAQLSKEGYQRHLAPMLTAEEFSEARLRQGLISYLLDFNRFSSPELCLVKLLHWTGEVEKLHTFLRRLTELELEPTLRRWILAYFDEDIPEMTAENLIPLRARFKYNILMRNQEGGASEDSYTHLRISKPATRHKLWSLFQLWQEHPIYSKSFDDFWEVQAIEIVEEKVLGWYGTTAAYGYIGRGLKEAALAAELPQLTAQPALVKERIQAWRDGLQPEDALYTGFEFVWQAASVFQLLNSYKSFRFNTPEAFIDKYTQELYRIDFHYRKALLHLAHADIYQVPGHADIAKTLHDAYDSFLTDLNHEWLQMLQERKFDFSGISVLKQPAFYDEYLRNFEYNAVVIISDALRYECAQELMDELIADKRNVVKLDAMMASIPSVTSLGMTQLLPHKEIELQIGGGDNQRLDFRIEGLPTSSPEQRNRVLQQFNEGYAAFSFKDIKGLDRNQGRELLKPHSLVYIYHDHIDAIGDTAKTENSLVEAVETALKELKELIGKLTGSWNRGHVFVTADHGFLYNYRPLSESQKEALPRLKGEVYAHNRFVIAEKDKTHVEGYRMPLASTSPIQSELEVILPRAANRFKRGGHGQKFVHGGGSLQELLVPVMKIYRQREDKREHVRFRILPLGKEIRSNTLKVSILQEEPVSNRLKGRRLLIGLYSAANELLSEEQEVLLESAATTPRERTSNLLLHLTARGSQASLCQLRAFDPEEDPQQLNPLHDQRMIIKTLFDEKDEF